jgi:hypothetical protein
VAGRGLLVRKRKRKKTAARGEVRAEGEEKP